MISSGVKTTAVEGVLAVHERTMRTPISRNYLVERNYLSLCNCIIGGLKTERSGERLLFVISAVMSLIFRRLLHDRAASFVARSQ